MRVTKREFYLEMQMVLKETCLVNRCAHLIRGVVPLCAGPQGQRLAHDGQVVGPGGPVQQQLRAKGGQAVRGRHPAPLTFTICRLLNKEDSEVPIYM